MALPEMTPNPWPGPLIAFEGVARAGKSRAIEALRQVLASRGREAVVSSWNSVPAMNALILEKKRGMNYTPLTWSLLHLTDFALRYEETMVPALQAGLPVIADRYVFTALARDVPRGVSREYVAGCYSFAVRPDLVFYLRVPAEVALARHKATTGKLYPHSSGLDIWPHLSLEEGYLRYQTELDRLYAEMVDSYGMHLVDGTAPPETVAARIVETALSILGPRLSGDERDQAGGKRSADRGVPDQVPDPPGARGASLRIFLAAPFTQHLGSDGRVIPERRAALVSIRTYLDPFGSVFLAHEREAWGERLMPPEVCVPADYREMREADVVFICPGEPLSPGVCVEAGWASALGKPIIIYRPPDERAYDSRPVSPMLTGLGYVAKVWEIERLSDAGPILRGLADAFGTGKGRAVVR